ncbi:energy transducer TonB [Novosphingobium sp.]|uniref:energy transducer TonB n=1 Tax=Novosphingobium sp. TaxID=1874826 RepID=UPI001ED3D7ED|nr:energy transducer TonB [Novosphingobium sp.]MBK6801605.1 TonB family protein [Novosphingobium sp.]MBK9010495.1 TonB family protein [Novosphingobium sp.]
MAYAGTAPTPRRIGTFGAVALIHVAAGYALVTGLAAEFTRTLPTRLVSTFQTVPPRVLPPPPPTPQPRDNRTLPTKAPPPIPASDFALGPVQLPPVMPSAGAGEGGGVGEALFPVPPRPTPSPAFTARGAKPRGNPGLWVTPNDYPAQDLREEHTGVTRVRLAIDREGRVAGCEVTASSGWPRLDATACDKLASRARFEPATDDTGARVPGSFATGVRWEIPD